LSSFVIEEIATFRPVYLPAELAYQKYAKVSVCKTAIERKEAN